MTAVMPLTAPLVSALVTALADEATAIDQLREALLAQRAGIAADDPAEVDASIDLIGRRLLLVDEARRRRAMVAEELAGEETTALDRLEAVAMPADRTALGTARDAVRQAARRAAQEAAINQRILRGALAAGDAFLQQLFAAATPREPVYRGAGGDEAARESGLLLNRTV